MIMLSGLEILLKRFEGDDRKLFRSEEILWERNRVHAVSQLTHVSLNIKNPMVRIDFPAIIWVHIFKKGKKCLDDFQICL